MPLVFRESQIKNHATSHVTCIRTAIAKCMENNNVGKTKKKLEPSYAIGKNVK